MFYYKKYNNVIQYNITFIIFKKLTKQKRLTIVGVEPSVPLLGTLRLRPYGHSNIGFLKLIKLMYNGLGAS